MSIEPSNKELELLNEIYPVTQQVIEHLTLFNSQLRLWQSKTNLVAPSTLNEFWVRHIADSLQLFALYPQKRLWTDIGSGGGFPGLVIAILLTQNEQEGSSIRMVESIQKKSSFLRSVSAKVQAPAEIFPKRIESAHDQLKQAEIITARALASLDKLFELTEGCLADGRIGLFHKGRDFERELEECRGKWQFDLIVHTSKIDAESVILEVANVHAI